MHCFHATNSQHWTSKQTQISRTNLRATKDATRNTTYKLFTTCTTGKTRRKLDRRSAANRFEPAPDAQDLSVLVS